VNAEERILGALMTGRKLRARDISYITGLPRDTVFSRLTRMWRDYLVERNDKRPATYWFAGFGQGKRR